MSLYQQPSWIVFTLLWALARRANEQHRLISVWWPGAATHGPTCLHIQTHWNTFFLVLGLIGIGYHSYLLISPVRPRPKIKLLWLTSASQSIPTLFQLPRLPFFSSHRFKEHWWQRWLFALNSILSLTILPNQDQSLPWLPSGTMLLVIYSPIFEAHH